MGASRQSADNGHILIGGTGRAGTTLLVQYFTALGFDTGFTLEQATTRVDPISRGGLEHSLGRTLGRGEPLPYVAKSPWFAKSLGDHLASGELKVRCCIVPMRSLFGAAESRRSVSERAGLAGRDPDKHPGGMIRAKRGPHKGQEEKLAVQFYKLLHTLVEHEVPTYFLSFPDFATGKQSLHAALGPLLREHDVTEGESERALRAVVDTDLINAFDQPPPT